MKELDYVKIYRANILNCTLEELIDFSDEAILQRVLVKGTGVNLNQLYLVKKNEEFARAIENCKVLVPDGTPIMWIAKWMNKPLKQKIPGPEYTLELFRLAASKGYKVFILGGKPGSAEQAIKNLVKEVGSFEVAGLYCPPFGFENDTKEVSHIVEMLRQSKADILIMALGAPKQELFVEKYQDDFRIPIVFGSGIAVDYYAGRVKKAPEKINKVGLEWLYRLMQEPRRLFSRYIIHDLPLLLELWFWAHRKHEKNNKGNTKNGVHA